MPNYMNGKIYKLVGNGKIYIGSTTQILCKRKTGHVSDYKCGKYCTSYEIVSDPNHYIELIENVPCNSKEELIIKERFWIENMNCINKCIPYRSEDERIHQKKKRYIDNKDKLLKQKKEYYEGNKDKLLEQNKLYREANKDKIKEYQKRYHKEKKAQLI